MAHLHKVLQDNQYPTQFFQQGKPQQKANKKPNPSPLNFIEGARVVVPYIKGLSEQYRHTLEKYRVRFFFKGTRTIKSLLMFPKDLIPDEQKTDIIYHWKCPANNCTAKYIGETSRSLKERVSDHRNQTTSANRNLHISTKHPKAELKDFTIIDRDTIPYTIGEKKHFIFVSRIHHSTETLAKSESLQYFTNFSSLLDILPHSSIPPTQGGTFFTWSFNTKTINTSHLHLQ